MDSAGKDLILEEFMTNPQYVSLSAVKNNHVYAVNANIISRPGPRIADAAEEVSRIIRTVEEECTASQPVTAPESAATTPGFTTIAAALGLLAIVAGMKK